jgi:hypothetical protein
MFSDILVRPVRLQGVTTQDHNLNTHRCGYVYKALLSLLTLMCCCRKITALYAVASVHMQRVGKAMHYCSTYGLHGLCSAYIRHATGLRMPRHNVSFIIPAM